MFPSILRVPENEEIWDKLDIYARHITWFLYVGINLQTSRIFVRTV